MKNNISSSLLPKTINAKSFLLLCFILLFINNNIGSIDAASYHHDSNSCGVLNVLDYGAKGDGKALDTDAIKKTFAAALNKKGCIILFPSGHTFFTGPFNITSTGNLEIQIETGTTFYSRQSVPCTPKFTTRM